MKGQVGRWRSSLLVSLMLVAALAMPAVAESSVLGSGESIAAVAATAKPSVVGILTTLKASRSTERGRAAGTGFVYAEGVIITNAHVVENASEVKILYADQTVETVPPSQIFADAVSDIAVIKVAATGLTPLAFADSDKLQVGQTVVAVGNPLGFRLGNSVSAGILSGMGRALGSGYPFLQIDAAINPGNSGGPLFNLQGHVIGINSAKMVEVGVEGLGFAIPSNTAREIATILLKDGKVERAVLGIAFDEGWEAYYGVPNSEGVTIASIIDDGPAGLTALRYGDKLIRLDQTPISTVDDVSTFLASKKPGDQVIITVLRRGQQLSARITLASQDELRRIAEEEGVEAGGILIGLNAGQIQEAAEFGRTLSWGWGRVNPDYFAVSGNDFAILYTEYLFVARKIASAYQFGFTPGVGYQQSVAKEINQKVEVQFELNGSKHGFLNGASFYLEQGSIRRTGQLYGQVMYTNSPDGKVVVAGATVRFSSANLNPVGDLTVKVVTQDGKTEEFQFTIKDLR